MDININKPIYDRTARLLGEEKTKKLASAHVVLFGLGGVGGYVFEALCRAGVRKITVVDCDSVSDTNFNRQILATAETLGKHKCEAATMRAKSINSDVEICEIREFVTAENAENILKGINDANFIADAIDNVAAKTAIIKYATENGISVISSMGTGNKTDPSLLKVSDIFKTDTCPLARAMRLSLKKAGVKKCPVLWSAEQPLGKTENENGRNVPGSLSTVPAAAGILIAAHIINSITK